MSKKIIIIMTISAFALALSVGCNSSKSPTPVPATIFVQPTITAPAMIVPPKETPVVFPVPDQLVKLETDSKDIMVDIGAKDWTTAQEKVKAMKVNVGVLKTLTKTARVPVILLDSIGAVLTELEKQVSLKKVYEAKVQANALTKLIPDIADYYRVTFPTDIGRLAYLGREIQLNVEKSDWTSAKKNYDSGIVIWNKLKTKLGTANKTSISIYDESIRKVGVYIGKKDTSSTNKEIKTMLEKTDDLQKRLLVK